MGEELPTISEEGIEYMREYPEFRALYIARVIVGYPEEYKQQQQIVEIADYICDRRVDQIEYSHFWSVCCNTG